MSDSDIVIISILEDFLGKPRKLNDIQYEFNCPTPNCSADINKHNLTFRLKDYVFNCWKCHYSGKIHKLIKDYGSKEHAEKINIVLPYSGYEFSGHKKSNIFLNENKSTNLISASKNVICELPEGYKYLFDPFVNIKSYNYKKAMAYLESRRVSKDMIERYHIGYTEYVGNRKCRIVVPSYNENNQVNYYDARTYLKDPKYVSYLKPKHPDKSSIVFNLSNINFDLPVYIVEGVFDMLPLYNAIPLLGKTVSDLLLSYLLKYKSRVVICLDEDAITNSVELYDKFKSYDLDVYFVNVKNDISKYHELYGKQELIKMLKNYKKLDFLAKFEMMLNK